MFYRLKSILRYINLKKENYNQNTNNASEASNKEPLTRLEGTIKHKLEDSFENCCDFQICEIASRNRDVKILIAFIDGLIDKNVLNCQIIDPITSSDFKSKNNMEELRDCLSNKYLIGNLSFYEEVVEEILCGYAVIFVDGEKTALKVNVRYSKERVIEEPDTEPVVRGPREGFIENIRVNISLIRRKIRDVNFKTEMMRLGTRTKTDIALCYIKGIAREDIVQEVRLRLSKIKTDAILESGYIEEFIEDNPLSVLATVGNTQRPDVVALKLLAGRIAVLVDGTPHVLTVPHIFIENIQANEDYYQRHFISSLVRIVRAISILISIFLPGLYVALVTFHQEMIPTIFVGVIAVSRDGVPFAALLETLIMVVVFEIFREAGARLPRSMGPALSIFGSLLLGEIAVTAGLTSPVTVIVIVIAGIASLAVPPFTEAMTIYRFVIIISSGIMGLFGFICCAYIITAQAVNLQSFGVPYALSLAPFRRKALKDSLVRLPQWFMKDKKNVY